LSFDSFTPLAFPAGEDELAGGFVVVVVALVAAGVTLGDPYVAEGESKKQYGREFKRKKQTEQKGVEHQNGGVEHGEAKMTVIERIGLARVLLSKDQQAQEKKERKIIVQHTQLTALNHKIQRALQCATATNDPDDWKRYRVLEDEDTVLRTSMESCLDSPLSIQDIVCDVSSSKKSSIDSSKMFPASLKTLRKMMHRHLHCTM
jgi:hypothetical protein